ncbi:MAG: LLM class flavin-dependent oxidoreductase [Burkholderiales bacterium]|nr:LLM class flavin-dependent oxidoreductase [Burkholderiales bacterium]
MEFGVFDHLDASGRPLGEFYEDRLRLVEACERFGLYAYHTAEHHGTPLGMSPSPSVFHAAVAQRTRRIRFGPLVYTLNLYHPLRLAEEICMLDHMSGGRFLLGVGRGVSPFEVGFFGGEVERGQPMYFEVFQILMKALTSDAVSHEGEFFRLREVPVMLRPLQRPHPPLWYGAGVPAASPWAAANRVHMVTNVDGRQSRAITDLYREEWAKAGNAASDIPHLGAARHVVIADTDAEAIATGRRAYARWYESYMNLWVKFGARPRNTAYHGEFDELLASRVVIAGSPQTARRAIAEEIEAAGLNYFVCRFAFGDLSLAESMRSVELFAREVKPALAAA